MWENWKFPESSYWPYCCGPLFSFNRYCSLRLKCCSGATPRGQIENAPSGHVTSGIVRFCANLTPVQTGENQSPRGQDSLNLNLTPRDLGFIKNKSMIPFLGSFAAVLWWLTVWLTGPCWLSATQKFSFRNLTPEMMEHVTPNDLKAFQTSTHAPLRDRETSQSRDLKKRSRDSGHFSPQGAPLAVYFIAHQNKS